ncbi:hypothetical protein B0H13DRAFT_2676099 [Mycena leptocephala]|nr:hypothetical protein B0H13DRAFT_2676099 [Mycena leptocephala]
MSTHKIDSVVLQMTPYATRPKTPPSSLPFSHSPNVAAPTPSLRHFAMFCDAVATDADAAARLPPTRLFVLPTVNGAHAVLPCAATARSLPLGHAAQTPLCLPSTQALRSDSSFPPSACMTVNDTTRPGIHNSTARQVRSGDRSAAICCPESLPNELPCTPHVHRSAMTLMHRAFPHDIDLKLSSTIMRATTALFYSIYNQAVHTDGIASTVTRQTPTNNSDMKVTPLNCSPSIIRVKSVAAHLSTRASPHLLGVLPCRFRLQDLVLPGLRHYPAADRITAATRLRIVRRGQQLAVGSPSSRVSRPTLSATTAASASITRHSSPPAPCHYSTAAHTKTRSASTHLLPCNTFARIRGRHDVWVARADAVDGPPRAASLSKTILSSFGAYPSALRRRPFLRLRHTLNSRFSCPTRLFCNALSQRSESLLDIQQPFYDVLGAFIPVVYVFLRPIPNSFASISSMPFDISMHDDARCARKAPPSNGMRIPRSYPGTLAATASSSPAQPLRAPLAASVFVMRSAYCILFFRARAYFFAHPISFRAGGPPSLHHSSHPSLVIRILIPHTAVAHTCGIIPTRCIFS